mgnify:CR=1 FL=1
MATPDVAEPEVSETEPVDTTDNQPEPEDNLATEPKGAETQESQPAVEAKKPYTTEELEELLTSDEDIDTSRLDPAGKLLAKSFQRGYNDKLLKLKEERREVEAQKPAQPQDPKEQYYQAYLQNPMAIVSAINAEAQKLEAQFELEKAGNLRGVLAEFQARSQMESAQGARVSRIVAETEAEIKRAIPDIVEKEPKLTAFAIEKLGLTPQGIQMITNPALGYVSKKDAVGVVNAVNQLYDLLNAAKTISKKVKKSVPAPLEGGGSGREPDTEEEKSISMEEYYKRHNAQRIKRLKATRGQ